jgi:hypothetical protein
MGLIFVHGLLKFTKEWWNWSQTVLQKWKKIENQTCLIFEIEKVKCFEIEDGLKFTQPCYLQGNSCWVGHMETDCKATFHIMVFGLLKSPAQLNPLSVTSYATWAHK